MSKWRITSLPDINGVELVTDIEAETVLTTPDNDTFAFYNGNDPIAVVRSENLFTIVRIDAIIDQYGNEDDAALDAEVIQGEQ